MEHRAEGIEQRSLETERHKEETLMARGWCKHGRKNGSMSPPHHDDFLG